MQSFFENMPPQYAPTLKKLIEAMRETQELLRTVRDRYGTDNPAELRALVGQEIAGVIVAENAVEELEALLELHEERRGAIRTFFLQIGEEGAPTEILDE